MVGLQRLGLLGTFSVTAVQRASTGSTIKTAVNSAVVYIGNSNWFSVALAQSQHGAHTASRSLIATSLTSI